MTYQCVEWDVNSCYWIAGRKLIGLKSRYSCWTILSIVWY